MTGASIADSRSTTPDPPSYEVSPTSFAVLTSAARSWSAVYSGCCCLRSAAAPATCGVAIEVPLIATYEPSPGLSAERAAVTSSPGPTSSGLRAPENASGPVLEK